MTDNPRYDWLDVLSDGSIFRHMLALFIQPFWASLIVSVMAGMLATSISLIIILIGLPLFLFTLQGLRTLADLDRRLFATLLDISAPQAENDLDMTAANIGERLGMLLGSGITWRSAMYLALRMVMSFVGFAGLMVLLPFLALEMMILAPLGIDMRLLTPRLLHWLARVTYDAVAWVLPTDDAGAAAEANTRTTVQPKRRATGEKPKRARLDNDDAPPVPRQARARLEDAADDGREEYYLSEDGEIRKRNAG